MCQVAFKFWMKHGSITAMIRANCQINLINQMDLLDGRVLARIEVKTFRTDIVYCDSPCSWRCKIPQAELHISNHCYCILLPFDYSHQNYIYLAKHGLRGLYSEPNICSLQPNYPRRIIQWSTASCTFLHFRVTAMCIYIYFLRDIRSHLWPNFNWSSEKHRS